MKNNQNTNEEVTSQKSNALRERPEQWRAKLSPVQRAFAQQIARLTDEVTETKRIEIRRERGEIRARVTNGAIRIQTVLAILVIINLIGLTIAAHRILRK